MQPAREHLQALFAAHPYLTRLYTTLSPAEMTDDPVFGANPDLPGYSNVHAAVLKVSCAGDEPDFDNAVVELADGQIVRRGAETVRRQDGQSVRGAGVVAAVRIEQLGEHGDPAVLEDHTADLVAASEDGGCGCRFVGGGASGWAMLFVLAALLGLRRRGA